MLTETDFGDFVREVHGRASVFPWQQALLTDVLRERRWPDAIDVPTGLGKTSVLDVAVFAAAVEPTTAPRRVFFVVDRRIVVDEAYEHAGRLRAALAGRFGPVTAAVADALRQPGDTEVLEVARMRGGTTWDARWVERPDRYAVVVGTVDQVGSRLLFRGYGVTEQARGIDAALVGTDSLIVVDEAHLAEPFLRTVEAMRELDAHPLDRPPTVITMSATPRGGARVHRITAADAGHEVAGRRLRARKTLHTVEMKATRRTADTVMVDALTSLATGLATDRVVGVVVNTVARARAVFDQVRREGVPAVLLTGRIRPVDRDYLLARYLPRIGIDRPRPVPEPLVVVATQSIEVGANIDLDALVTESAPMSSLVQRLGRLNRVGLADVAAPAFVVQDTTVTSDDPVYGPARLATWRWLSGQVAPLTYGSRPDPTAVAGGIDASPAALRELCAEPPGDLTPVSPYTPILTGATLDAWVCTSPQPEPSPPVAPFLHGLTDDQPAVRVVWRARLGSDRERWSWQLDAVPPASEEMLEVSVAAVRRWLDAARADPLLTDRDTNVGDDETTVPSVHPHRERDLQGRPMVLRYRGRENSDVIPSSRIEPGDLIVVPAEYGGCDEFGWNPSDTRPVIDVADLASRRGRPILRVGPYLRDVIARYHPDVVTDAALDKILAAATEDATERAIGTTCRPLLAELAEVSGGGGLPFPRNLARLTRGMRCTATDLGDGREDRWSVVLSAHGVASADDASEAGSSTGSAPRRMELDSHQRQVADRARQFASNLHVPAPLMTAVETAALLHDEGKRDPRFQMMLWNGDRASADAAPWPLAKSGMDPADPAAFRRARELSRYPRGMRHEALSARIAALRLSTESSMDVDLVIHLVQAHHGYGRPLLPPVIDHEPVTVSVGGTELSTSDTIDWAQPARFAALNARYGRWGLVLLETIVRLADIWCSEHHEEAACPR